MKLPRPNISTETSKMLSESYFGIGDMGVVFDILRNKLYSDPIAAICREIMSNARDAHREIGKADLPIQVSMPNNFDQNIKFRDFGFGISPDRMENVFIKYANSTKREDNVQQGCFGLGAKSPFSYSDSFTIITYIKGTQRTYHAFIDETQIGKIVQSAEMATSEKDGTCIVIPVIRQDNAKFAQCVLDTGRFWDIRPNVIGGNIVFPKLEVVLQGTEWELLAKNPTGGWNQHSFIIIDGISYPFDVSKLSSSNDNNIISYNNFLLTFPNGKLSLAASRDSIQYDEKTVKAIKEKITKVHEEIFGLISAKIDSCKTYIEAIKTLQAVRNISSREYKWRGHKVYSDYIDREIGDIRVTEYGHVFSRGKNKAHAASLNTDLKIYFDDLEKERLPINAIAHLTSLDSRFQIIFKRKSVTPGWNPKINKELMDLLGVIPLSTITFPKKVYSRGTRDAKLDDHISYRPLNWTVSHGNLDKYVTQKPSSDFIDKHGYVIYDGVTISNKNGEIINSHTLKDIKDFLNIPIVGVSTRQSKSLPSSFVDLKEEVKAKLNEFFVKYPLEQIKKDYISQNISLNSIYSNPETIERYITYNKNKESIKNSKLFSHYIDVMELRERFLKAKPVLKMLAWLDLIDKDLPESELINEQNKIRSRYPLLSHLGYGTGQKLVIDYINLIDKTSHEEKK